MLSEVKNKQDGRLYLGLALNPWRIMWVDGGNLEREQKLPISKTANWKELSKLLLQMK